MGNSSADISLGSEERAEQGLEDKLGAFFRPSQLEKPA